jgi:hypothetical protein
MSERNPQIIRAVLKNTQELLTVGWVQENAAMTATGFVVPFLAKEACRFCLYAALERALFDLKISRTPMMHEVCEELRFTLRSRGHVDPISLIDWNDDPKRRHQEVIELISETLIRFEGRATNGLNLGESEAESIA